MNKIQLFLRLASEPGKQFYFTVEGQMAIVPRQGESVTIVQGDQKVEKVIHCLQLGTTEIRLAPSEYSELLQRYKMLKKIGWRNFVFNGLDAEVGKFLDDAGVDR